MAALDAQQNVPAAAARSAVAQASIDAPSLPVRIVAWCTLVFLVLPSLIIIPMSFSSTEMMVFPPRLFSVHLYREFFFRADWMVTAKQSLIVASFAALLSVILGSMAAYGLVRTEFIGKKLVMMIFLTPIFVPLVVVALAFYIYFSVLRLQGTTIALIAAHTAIVTPFVIVLITAALRKIDPAIEVAAATMGAGRFYVYTRVTIPMVAPAVVSAGLFAFLLSFDELIIAIFLTGFGTKTLPVKMYESLIYEVSPVLAAISTLLTVLAFLICILIVRGQTASGEGDVR